MPQAESNPSPSNKRKDVIVKFREAYAQAVVEAEVSAEHTATEGWRKLYSDHRLDTQNRRRSLSKSLRAMADAVEIRGTTEDDEKEIGEFKKSAVAIREADEAFDRQVIVPVRQPVEDCQKIITEHVNQAGREEREAPLHNTGLEILMRDEVATHPRARWDGDEGRVLVEPATTG